MSTSNKDKGIIMKKIAVGIILVLGLTTLQPASANIPKSIVIIDTAIDSTLPQFSGKLVQEVCIVTGGVCPNGAKFQEGPGAATLPKEQAYRNNFDHGTIMSLIANQVNPDVNIIFIRIAGINPRTGGMLTFSATEVKLALDWVIANKSKYNVVSVSSSVGTHVLNPGANYCPIRATHSSLIANINKLISLEVPTMFASGNNGNISRVDFPACIPAAIAVSGSDFNVDDKNFIGTWSNGGPDADFYALGVYTTPVKRAIGTSAATAAFSAYWAKNHKGTYRSTFDYMRSITSPIKNARTSTTLFVDVLK
jgi:hypothetical protein